MTSSLLSVISLLVLILLENIPMPQNTRIHIGIIAAFGQEADLLIQSLDQKSVKEINGRAFYTGLLENASVVITLSGISIVNAAMTTQIMIDHFHPENIIFSGIAGGLNPAFHIGDVVIASNWGLTDEIFFANSDALPTLSAVPGDLSALGLELMRDIPPFKNRFLRKTNVITATNHQQKALLTDIDGVQVPTAYGEMVFKFPVDAELLAISEQVIAETQTRLEKVRKRDGTDYAPQILIGDTGVSGGAFLGNVEFGTYLHHYVQADCVDMETAAVAQVAYSNQIPFIAFRSLSDLNGMNHDCDIVHFFDSGIAQRNAAKLTLAFVRQYQKSRL